MLPRQSALDKAAASAAAQELYGAPAKTCKIDEVVAVEGATMLDFNGFNRAGCHCRSEVEGPLDAPHCCASSSCT